MTVAIQVSSVLHKKLYKTNYLNRSTNQLETVGRHFAVDLLRQFKQKIILVIEDFYLLLLKYYCQTKLEIFQRRRNCTVFINEAPKSYSLVNDGVLKKLGIRNEIGRAKNKNKSPAAEKAEQEIETEIKQLLPEGGPISQVTLAIVTSNLNSKIRLYGLNVFEMSAKIGQYTRNDLNCNDKTNCNVNRKEMRESIVINQAQYLN